MKNRYWYFSLTVILFFIYSIATNNVSAEPNASTSLRQQETWLNYQYKSPSPPAAEKQTNNQSPFTAPSFGRQVSETKAGNFVIPILPGSNVYQRPAEIITSSPNSSTTMGNSMFQASMPWTLGGIGNSFYSPYYARPYGLGFGGFGPMTGLGFGSYNFAPGFSPLMGGLGNFGVFPGIGGFTGLGGIGPMGGLGFAGFTGPRAYWGSPYYGFFSPGMGALAAGASVGFMNRPRMTHTQVIQTAPSKASGNYYQPSTIDPTASGSYYAGSGGAMPVLSQPESPKDYWGPGGNPFSGNSGQNP